MQLNPEQLKNLYVNNKTTILAIVAAIMGAIGLNFGTSAVTGTAPAKGSPEWVCSVENQNVVVYDSFSQRSFCVDPRNRVFIGDLADVKPVHAEPAPAEVTADDAFKASTPE
jgi:hypothetical protein